MTKFEEEFKALTSWDWVNVDLIQKILTKFGNWHPDEEYQELFDKYSNLNDSYEKEVIRSSKLESQIIDLKSQLQQQALPVVPDCFAEWISEDIENNTVVEDILTIIITSDDKDLKEYGLWIKKNPVTYVIARTLGYTVEKPQLFYLREKNTGYYLRKTGNDEYGITAHYSNDYDENYMHYKFTQQEIDSMQSGSYEQIEVEK
ncbi:MAG: DUF1642 domain-containing protein [Lactococcus lactis]|nr:DUF1642 domain-containing protein [Lactococcus lactis]MDN5439256.1 DUF1642 domain-containing protein [Lactococcus lactis]MDN5471183.1 DUF1642 domain-containing protein [Lactococcus lactis]MDN5948047.1 DUF1642 domain-containing protein [Lactococcus lactis]MDN5950413.1 DUF1642 domain-containing protein [Lactococcus lactis]